MVAVVVVVSMTCHRLRSLQELHQRLVQHEGVRFQLMGRQQNGADTVLAEALLPPDALLELGASRDLVLPACGFSLSCFLEVQVACCLRVSVYMILRCSNRRRCIACCWSECRCPRARFHARSGGRHCGCQGSGRHPPEQCHETPPRAEALRGVQLRATPPARQHSGCTPSPPVPRPGTALGRGTARHGTPNLNAKT